jgi:hypothetical protein
MYVMSRPAEVRVPRFDNPIEFLFAQEAAASLGFSGRRLRKALDALQKYDSDATAGASRCPTTVRAELVADAGEALWAYGLVQRSIQFALRLDFFAERLSAGPATAGQNAARSFQYLQ